MAKLCGIYCITNMLDGKRYVGSSNNIDGRWRDHRSKLNNGTHPNSHILNAWRRDGADRFCFAICQLCESHELIEREQFYIDHFQSVERPTGYNLAPRADRSTHSHETREKISAFQRGRKRSPEFCAKIAAANVGKQFTPEAIAKSATMRRGVKLSAEHVAKLSESHRGHKPTPNAIAKTAAFNRGRKRSPETIAKSAAGHRGQKRTAEQRQRIAAGAVIGNKNRRARKRQQSSQLTLNFAELDLA